MPMTNVRAAQFFGKGLQVNVTVLDEIQVFLAYRLCLALAGQEGVSSSVIAYKMSANFSVLPTYRQLPADS